jgi:hypothetical protein
MLDQLSRRGQDPSCANGRQERQPQAAHGHDRAEAGLWSRRSWSKRGPRPRFVGVGAPADPARWEASGGVGLAILGAGSQREVWPFDLDANASLRGIGYA